MKQVIASLVILTVLQGWGIQPAAAADQKHPAKVNTAPIQILAIQEISSLTLNPNSVTGGAMVTGTLALKVPAPSAGLKVNFKSSKPAIAAVPSGTVVQAGATSATFIVQTYPVVVNPNVIADPPSVQISAQIENSAPKIVKLTVLPPAFSSFAINPANVAGGNNSTGTVTISGPAPAGGIVIPLSSKQTTSTAAPPGLPPLGRGITPPGTGKTPSAPSQPGVSMPSQVAIAAGATSATFAITTTPVSASTTFQVNANWNVYLTKTATLTVAPVPPPTIASVSTPNQYGVRGGTPFTGKVTLTAPAPAQGMVIYLQINGTTGTTGQRDQCGQFPSVPSTVTLAGGAASATFTVTTYPGYGLYGLTASPTKNLPSNVPNSWWTLLYVDSPFFHPVLPSTVKGGTAAQGSIQLTDGSWVTPSPAMPANCGNRYVLASSNTNFAQVPPYVDVPLGATQGTFPIITSALPAGAAPVTVTISVTGTFSDTGRMKTPVQDTTSTNLTITP